MEKIKSILNPGAKQDDEVLYGSGQSSDPIHSGSTGSGAGSHFGSSRTANTEAAPLSSNNPTSTTGTSSYGNNPTATSTGGLGSSYNTAPTTSGSRMPGSFDDDDTSSTTAIRSGVAGQSHRGSGLTGSSDINKPLPNQPGTSTLGSGAKTTAGPYSSKLENKLDPRVDSDMDGSRGLSGNTGTSGSTLTGSSLPDRSVGNTGYGNTSNTGNTGVTGSGLGRDAAIGAAGVGAGEAAHHHHGHNQGYGRDSLDTNSGRSFPLSGNSNTASAASAGPHSSNLANKADPRVDSDLNNSRTAGNAGYGSNVPSGTTSGYGSNTPGSTAGPHNLNLANKADPRVDSDLDGSRTTGNKGYGTNTSNYGNQPTTGSSQQTHLGRDAALGGAGLAEHERHKDYGLGNTGLSTGSGQNKSGYATGLGHHQHEGPGHNFSGDPCGPEAAAPGPHFVQGPHATDTANKLDPHVSLTPTGLGGAGTTTGTGHHGHHHGQSTTATGLGSTGTDYDNQRGDNHLGRDAALGVAGVGAYEAGRHPSSSSTTGAQTTAGPVHNSSLLNKIDPRVKQQDTSNTRGSYGVSGLDPTGSHGLSGTSQDHHYGRDATAAGAVGAVGYEAEKHHHKDNVSGTSGISGTGTGTGPGYGQHSGSTHYGGRDATLAAGGTAAAYQAEKHHHNKDQSLGATSGVAGNTYDQQPRSGHHGRDAALATGGTAAAYEAEKHHHNRDQPLAATSSSTYPSSYDERNTSGTHNKGDAALGAGAGAIAGSEFSKKDAERDHKQLVKEESKHEKALEKDHRHQEKELKKEEKHHDKLLAKEEKKHEKALDKQEKKHEKEAEKDVKHDGKKGGIFGFLHRDKSDPELKDEEAVRKGTSTHPGARSAEAGVVAGSAVGMTEHERYQHEKNAHERNRLHKDPPASVTHASNTKYAEEPQSGYASQVTGGTGTTALAQGESVPRGSHMTGLGNKLDPAVAGRGENVNSGIGGGSTSDRTIEPHTGLPIDYSKGDGNYGTDGTRMPGRHTHDQSGVPGATGPFESGTTGQY